MKGFFVLQNLTRSMIVAAAVLGFSGAASAEIRITSTAGNVMVNQGVGYRPVQGDAVLKAGDRIMVGQAGAGRVSFADGCVVALVPGITTIGKSSPCKVKAQLGGSGFGLGGNLGIGLGIIGTVGGLTLALEKIQENQDNKSP